MRYAKYIKSDLKLLKEKDIGNGIMNCHGRK